MVRDRPRCDGCADESRALSVYGVERCQRHSGFLAHGTGFPKPEKKFTQRVALDVRKRGLAAMSHWCLLYIGTCIANNWVKYWTESTVHDGTSTDSGDTSHFVPHFVPRTCLLALPREKKIKPWSIQGYPNHPKDCQEKNKNE